MLWQLASIWAIVGTVTVWFLRDEMHLARSRQLQRLQRIVAGPSAPLTIPMGGMAPATTANPNRARFLAALARD